MKTEFQKDTDEGRSVLPQSSRTTPIFFTRLLYIASHLIGIIHVANDKPATFRILLRFAKAFYEGPLNCLFINTIVSSIDLYTFIIHRVHHVNQETQLETAKIALKKKVVWKKLVKYNTAVQCLYLEVKYSKCEVFNLVQINLLPIIDEKVWACGQNPTLMSVWLWRSTVKAFDLSPLIYLHCLVIYPFDILQKLKKASMNSHKSPKLASTMLKATYTLYFISKITQKLSPRYVILRWSRTKLYGLSGQQKKRDQAKRTAERHLLIVPEKLIDPKSTRKQTKYKYTGQSPIKAKPKEGEDKDGIIQHTIYKKLQYSNLLDSSR